MFSYSIKLRLAAVTVLTLFLVRTAVARPSARSISNYISRSTHPQVRSHLAKRADLITLPVISDVSGSYIEIEVGDPPQALLVLLDTGSADFWLKSTQGPTDDGDVRYDPGTSPQSLGEDVVHVIEYSADPDNDSTRFKMYADAVTVGGRTVPDVPVGAAISWSSQFLSDNDFLGDGLLGLGFPKLSASAQKPLVNFLADNGIIPDPTVSLKILDPLTAGNRKDKSVVTLGGADPALFEGPFLDLDVISDTYWLVAADSISVNGRRITTSPVDAHIDTGTTRLIGTLASARALHEHIPGWEEDPEPALSGHVEYVIPCNSDISITIVFAGQAFTLSAEDLLIDEFADSDGSEEDAQPEMCKSVIMGSDVHRQGWILGEVFLRTVYTKLSQPKPPLRTKAQVSFAKLKEPEWLPGKSPSELRAQTHQHT